MNGITDISNYAFNRNFYIQTSTREIRKLYKFIQSLLPLRSRDSMNAVPFPLNAHWITTEVTATPIQFVHSLFVRSSNAHEVAILVATRQKFGFFFNIKKTTLHTSNNNNSLNVSIAHVIQVLDS